MYTAKQTERILKQINKKTKVIISIFAGRAGDTGKDPIPQLVKSLILKYSQNWLRGTDLNRRPSGYEPDELPDCSTPRYF